MNQDMNVHEFFVPGRFLKILKFEFLQFFKPLWIINLIIFLFFINTGILSSLLFRNYHNPEFFLSLYLLIGVFLAAFTFAPLSRSETGIFYILLPASSLEKYLVRLLISLFGYAIAGFAVLFASSLLLELLRMIVTASPVFDAMKLISLNLLNIFAGYALFHSLYFLGSILFRNLGVLYISLIILGVFLVFVIFFAVFWVLMAMNALNGQMNQAAVMEFFSGRFKNIEMIIKIISWILPVIFYVLAYFLFRKKQILS
jgi:hypothetical protein